MHAHLRVQLIRSVWSHDGGELVRVNFGMTPPPSRTELRCDLLCCATVWGTMARVVFCYGVMLCCVPGLSCALCSAVPAGDAGVTR